MKNLLTACFMIVSLSIFAQDKTTATAIPQTLNARTASTSIRVEDKTPEPNMYDVNDKYMGRKDEFLNMMTVPELPADFPLYDKQWGVKEYNAVVDAYCTTHLSILKERVKEKVQLQIDQH